jgi:hypothetical protein
MVTGNTNLKILCNTYKYTSSWLWKKWCKSNLRNDFINVWLNNLSANQHDCSHINPPCSAKKFLLCIDECKGNKNLNIIIYQNYQFVIICKILLWKYYQCDWKYTWQILTWHTICKENNFYILTFLFVSKATDTPEFPSGNIQTYLLKQIVIHWYWKIMDYARFKNIDLYTA